MNIKHLYINLVIVLLLFVTTYSSGQTVYAIPDKNFRKVLLTKYSQLMIGDKLDSASAAMFSDGLELDNSNISSLNGLQYFTNIPTLAARNNKLSVIPELAFLTKIQGVFLNSNQLIELPDLSALTQIVDLQVQNNQLTVLPSLTNLTTLQSLYCADNQLREFPDFSSNSNLTLLVAGNNPIRVTPDYSPLINLLELHIHQTNTNDTINGLSQLKKLTVLYAWQNNITDLSALNSNTKLTTFQVFQNNLSALPNLLNKPNLFYVNFSNNFLTFEDILSLQTHSNFKVFGYNPQKKITLQNHTNRLTDSLDIELNFDKTLFTNTYKWFKNDVLIDQTTQPIKHFSSLLYSDAGVYRVEITNSKLPDLTLKTTNSTLVVKSCLEIAHVTFDHLLIECGQGFNVRVSDLQLDGGIAPFDYTLKKGGTIIASSIENFFTHIEPGEYNYVINDSRGEHCSDSITMTVKNDTKCDLVFTPNGDGVMDKFFINHAGSIKIINTNRQVVAEFVGPASWDGTNFSGQHLPSGMYAIVINDSKVIQLTLIR